MNLYDVRIIYASGCRPIVAKYQLMSTDVLDATDLALAQFCGDHPNVDARHIQQVTTVAVEQHDYHVARFRTYQRAWMDREYRAGGERLS